MVILHLKSANRHQCCLCFAMDIVHGGASITRQTPFKVVNPYCFHHAFIANVFKNVIQEPR